MVLELSNILALYFAPHTRLANAVGVFVAWEKSKQDPDVHAFVNYLVYWVAGTKLIFILLLGVIVLFADPDTQRMSLAALAIATASFYWRMFPLIKKIDRQGQIEPRNYSSVLGVLIAVFISLFVLAIIL
jgi:hypothetical protein